MKRMIKFVIPIWISMIVSSLLGIIDYSFLNKISTNYIAIIGMAYVPYNFIDYLIIGIGIEANRATAKKKSLNFISILSFALILSIILVLISRSFSDILLFFAKDNIFYSDIKSYFNIIIVLLIPSSLFYLCTGILRGNGVPEKSVKFNLSALILNFILDYCFIKLNLLQDPLKGCALASVISDSIVSIIYVVYIIRSKLVDFKLKGDYKYIKNIITYSMEKICSSSTLELITVIYISKLTIESSAIYFAVDKYMGPILLLAHCHFEWIIYSSAKKIEYKRKKTYMLYMLILFLYSNIIIFYLNFNFNGIKYSYLYIFYCLAFFIERSTVAEFFSDENGAMVNKVIFVKNFILLLFLEFIFVINKFNLYSFIIIHASLVFGEVLYLKKVNHKKIKTKLQINIKE